MEAKIEAITFFLSASFSHFLEEVGKQTKAILAYEMGLKVSRSRFAYKGYTYPIKLLLFEGSDKLGFFDPMTLEIGLNKACANATKNSWLDILRHELAHYLTFIEFGTTATPHGPEFSTMIERYGFSPAVAKASGKLDIDQAKRKKSEMEQKLQKVMNLAKSHHVEEAKAALNKMQELTEKYQLESKAWEHKIEGSAFMKRALEFTRITGKIKAIQEILRTFFVTPVLNKGFKGGYLEVVGAKHDCEIACFVAHFLDHKLERLWTLQTELKGVRAKNSFFLGISKGYLQKQIPNSKKSVELVLIENQVATMATLFYPHLSSLKSSASRHNQAFLHGKRAGSELSIAQALKGVFTNTLLPFKR